jgi:hypothetical protein
MMNSSKDNTMILDFGNPPEEKNSHPENDSRKARYQEARQELKALSKMAKALVKEGAFDTVNEAIIQTCYTDDTHYEFKKFYEWKKEGKSIIKGSKGFPVWTRPIEREEDQKNDIDDKDDSTYWGICYLFSNAQVR